MAQAERKPDLSLVFGIGKPSEADQSRNEEPNPDIPPRFQDKAESLFDAIRSRNADSFVQALWDVLEAHEAGEEEEPEPDEGDEMHPGMHDRFSHHEPEED